MTAPLIQSSLNAGELSPSLYGRVDLAKYRSGCSTLRNAWASYKGGVSSRAGTKFVGVARQGDNDDPPALIPFQFSIDQGYLLIFGDREMSVVRNGAFITNDPFTISAATNANPAVITAAGNNFTTTSWVYITGMEGLTDLNGRTFSVSTTGSSFALASIFTGASISTTASGVYTTGGTVASIYTLATPYLSADVQELKWAQSADVMSLTHNDYPPMDLARIEDNNWTLTTTSFSASILPPTTITASPSTTTSSSASTYYQYVVTAVDTATGEESIASPIATITNSVNIGQTLGSETVTWSAVTGAQYYNVYKAPPAFAAAIPVGALFGYAASTFGLSWVDSNVVQDMTVTPPLHENPFAPGAILFFTMTSTGSGYVSTASNTVSIFGSGAGATARAVVSNGGVSALIVTNAGHDYTTSTTASVAGGSTTATAVATLGPSTGTYPGCVSYFQDRRFYANTANNPDTYFGSQPGAFTNMDHSIPINDSDAIVGTPWAQQVNGIQYMVPMGNGGMIMLTGLGAWQLSGGAPGAAVTPSVQVVASECFNGCAPFVRPLPINFDLLYTQSKGSIVRDLNYNFFANVYTGADLTVLSNHLFTGYDIVRWDWAEEPYKLVWAVRNDGNLLSMTYLKLPSVAGQSADNDIYSWARHDTDGLFKSVACVTEPPVDAPYFAVRRFLPGA